MICCILWNTFQNTDVFGDRYLCYMSVTSQALKICILHSKEGNMLGLVNWFLCSLCKGEQVWTDNCTSQKLGANLSPPSKGIIDSIENGTHYTLQESYMHSSYMQLQAGKPPFAKKSTETSKGFILEFRHKIIGQVFTTCPGCTLHFEGVVGQLEIN